MASPARSPPRRRSRESMASGSESQTETMRRVVATTIEKAKQRTFERLQVWNKGKNRRHSTGDGREKAIAAARGLRENDGPSLEVDATHCNHSCRCCRNRLVYQMRVLRTEDEAEWNGYKVVDLHYDLDVLKHEYDVLKTENQQLEATLRTLRTDHNTLQDAHNSLQADHQAAQQAVQAAQQAAQAAQQAAPQIAQLQQDLAAAEARVRELTPKDPMPQPERKALKTALEDHFRLDQAYSTVEAELPAVETKKLTDLVRNLGRGEKTKSEAYGGVVSTLVSFSAHQPTMEWQEKVGKALASTSQRLAKFGQDLGGGDEDQNGPYHNLRPRRHQPYYGEGRRRRH